MSKNGSAYHNLLNSAHWRRLRRATLDERPFCEDCAKEGLFVPATDVHHIRPVDSISDAVQMAEACYDRNNLAALCHDCHVKRHERIGSHSRQERDRRRKEEVKSLEDKIFKGGGHVF